ncbi:MAG: SBBP repeat-containing protein, partial [Armatimonadetes bacterium]|nr:SBBP repeat-containing protein [Armatimonadota bacterium]
TFLGGDSADAGQAIAVDTLGKAYVTGDTRSTDFPRKAAFQREKAGEGDAFVTKLSADGQNLAYSSFLGGDDDDVGFGIAIDASLNAYVTGSTRSRDFPPVSPFQAHHGGGTWDAFVSKISAEVRAAGEIAAVAP